MAGVFVHKVNGADSRGKVLPQHVRRVFPSVASGKPETVIKDLGTEINLIVRKPAILPALEFALFHFKEKPVHSMAGNRQEHVRHPVLDPGHFGPRPPDGVPNSGVVVDGKELCHVRECGKGGGVRRPCHQRGLFPVFRPVPAKLFRRKLGHGISKNGKVFLGRGEERLGQPPELSRVRLWLLRLFNQICKRPRLFVGKNQNGVNVPFFFLFNENFHDISRPFLKFKPCVAEVRAGRSKGLAKPGNLAAQTVPGEFPGFGGLGAFHAKTDSQGERQGVCLVPTYGRNAQGGINGGGIGATLPATWGGSERGGRWGGGIWGHGGRLAGIPADRQEETPRRGGNALGPGEGVGEVVSSRYEKNLAEANCRKCRLLPRFGNDRANFTSPKAKLPNFEKAGGWGA